MREASENFSRSFESHKQTVHTVFAGATASVFGRRNESDHNFTAQKHRIPRLNLKWAPQTAILGRTAVLLLISHCGWNSTVESMLFGKPVVGWPLFADQLANSVFLERTGMGESLVTMGEAGLFGGTKKSSLLSIS